MWTAGMEPTAIVSVAVTSGRSSARPIASSLDVD
jgi:hypothetical protein